MIAHSNRGRVTVDLGGNWRVYSHIVPGNFAVLGTVTRGAGDTGALAQNRDTGLYAQVNAGVFRSLPQSKVAAAVDAARKGRRGGPGMGGGRVAADGATDLTRKQVKLDTETIAVLTKLGGGNLSLGIRMAAHIVSGRDERGPKPLD